MGDNNPTSETREKLRSYAVPIIGHAGGETLTYLVLTHCLYSHKSGNPVKSLYHNLYIDFPLVPLSNWSGFVKLWYSQEFPCMFIYIKQCLQAHLFDCTLLYYILHMFYCKLKICDNFTLNSPMGTISQQMFLMKICTLLLRHNVIAYFRDYTIV